MKSGGLSFILAVLILLPECKQKIDCDKVIGRMMTEFNSGNFAVLGPMRDSVRKGCRKDFSQIGRADSIYEIARRTSIDFSLDEGQINAKMMEKLASYTNEEKQLWEVNGWLEYRVIDGQKRYFRRAASNLELIRKFHEHKDLILKDSSDESELKARLSHTTEILKLAAGKSDPVLPVNAEITFTITVRPDAVPDGEIIRCWMPWPKSNHSRQGSVELIKTSETDYLISPDSAVHSSLYMQHKAHKGMPSIFSISFRYRTYAQHFDLSPGNIKPYDTGSEIYKKYTAEQLPQIHFSKEIGNLADSISGMEKNPLKIAEKIYIWFKNNIPWAGALEYSVMPDIPGYVIRNRRGDCGMQTLLYMSMLRYKGIPVRWQSGWMIPPTRENLHDWCEIYLEGPGWVPSDVSYDLQIADNKNLRNYFFTGLDSYRMIVNDGISGNLYPAKKFLRSEPYDFQRGELEWRKGNLYFDKWDYEIKITYLNQ